MIQSTGPDNLQRILHPDYVEVVSKNSGGQGGVFECPYCAAIFDAFGAAQLALDTCVAHARTGYVVRDANGQSLAYVYSRPNLTEAMQAKVLTPDEAR